MLNTTEGLIPCHWAHVIAKQPVGRNVRAQRGQEERSSTDPNVDGPTEADADPVETEDKTKKSGDPVANGDSVAEVSSDDSFD